MEQQGQLQRQPAHQTQLEALVAAVVVVGFLHLLP
jgi:hypothetical protein